MINVDKDHCDCGAISTFTFDSLHTPRVLWYNRMTRHPTKEYQVSDASLAWHGVRFDAITSSCSSAAFTATVPPNDYLRIYASNNYHIILFNTSRFTQTAHIGVSVLGAPPSHNHEPVVQQSPKCTYFLTFMAGPFMLRLPTSDARLVSRSFEKSRVSVFEGWSVLAAGFIRSPNPSYPKAKIHNLKGQIKNKSITIYK